MQNFLFQTFSSFMILFAVIDILGSVPLIMGMVERGQKYNAKLAVVASLGFYALFFYAGQLMLSFLGVDIPSFAVAGSLVMLALAIEMIFDIKIFNDEAPTSNVTLVPLVFPLIAGPGSITTMLALRAEHYSDLALFIAVLMNLIVVFFVLLNVRRVNKFLGKGGLYALRKFFGITLLAISIKLIVANLAIIIGEARKDFKDNEIEQLEQTVERKKSHDLHPQSVQISNFYLY